MRPLCLAIDHVKPPRGRQPMLDMCADGRPECVDVTIASMRRRFEPLARVCDHDSVFALAYLRTTQTYKWARDQPGFFADAAWVNHEDAVFAEYYFAAYDNWAAGRRETVPEAWTIAFDAARTREVTGAGDLLLGMNAHINRDLPHALADVGLTGPGGLSRKPDHDRVNRFLQAVTAPLVAELTARFDPVSFSAVPGDPLFPLLAAWREHAWRNAELLAQAPDDAVRSVVEAQINAWAAIQARTIMTLTAYLPPLTSNTARDRYCAQHHGDPASIAYPFGTPEPY
jgi:hypothetical protein